MSVDSAEPTASYEEFIKGEARYAALYKANPERAAKLAAEAEKEAKARRQSYLDLADAKK